MTREYVDPIIVDLPSLSSEIGVQISALREHLFAESRSGQDLARACKIVWPVVMPVLECLPRPIKSSWMNWNDSIFEIYFTLRPGALIQANPSVIVKHPHLLHNS